MQKEIFLSYFQNYSQFRPLIIEVLKQHPDWINETFQRSSLVEFFIDYEEEQILIEHLPFIKELPVSTENESLIFYIFKKHLYHFLEHCLEYFPALLNIKDKSNTHLLEYLIDAKKSLLIQKNVQHFNFSLPSSKDYSLLHYLIYSDIPETLDFVLRNRLDLLNQYFGTNKPILECLIEQRYFEIIQELSSSFDFSLRSSKQINLFSYLVNAKLPRTLLAIVRSCPELLTKQGCDNVYPGEYLIDKRCFLVLKEFYHLIDFKVQSSHGEPLFFYLVHADMPDILEKVICEHPHFIFLEDSKQCTVLDYLKKYEEERLILLFEEKAKNDFELFQQLSKNTDNIISTLTLKDKIKFYAENLL